MIFFGMLGMLGMFGMFAMSGGVSSFLCEREFSCLSFCHSRVNGNPSVCLRAGYARMDSRFRGND